MDGACFQTRRPVGARPVDEVEPKEVNRGVLARSDIRESERKCSLSSVGAPIVAATNGREREAATESRVRHRVCVRS